MEVLNKYPGTKLKTNPNGSKILGNACNHIRSDRVAIPT
jgi:hypothetical protein